MLYYLAYGSNLHPLRLAGRIPAVFIGAVELPGHRLAFHKISPDGSGKCCLTDTGAAADSIHGALYAMRPEHKPALDEFEHGYYAAAVEMRCRQPYTCFTYFAQRQYIDPSAQPFHWYKQLVVRGAECLNFPAAYIAAIDAVQSTPDPDHKRRIKNQILLRKMTAANESTRA